MIVPDSCAKLKRTKLFGDSACFLLYLRPAPRINDTRSYVSWFRRSPSSGYSSLTLFDLIGFINQREVTSWHRWMTHELCTKGTNLSQPRDVIVYRKPVSQVEHTDWVILNNHVNLKLNWHRYCSGIKFLRND